MRKGWGWLGLAMLSASAWATDDLAQMNAVSHTWDRYVELSSTDDPASVDLLTQSSLSHFGFLRDAALYGSPEQLRRVPSADRLTVYLLRATQDEQVLKAMDERAVVTLCMERGWIGVNKEEDEPLPALTQVTVIDDRAVSELGPTTESQYQFGPDFEHEEAGWRIRYLSMVPNSSKLMDRSLKESGLTHAMLFEYVIARLLKVDNAPRLAMLDRALLDDSTARIALNERWPDYDSVFIRRIQALGRKTEDGDVRAQFVLGLMKISGEKPAWVPKDAAGGLALLEKASDGGNADAADAAAQYLSSDHRNLDEAGLTRLLRHVQRGADAGRMRSMGMLAQLYFEGAGGLQRNCRAAAEWYARAEEAGDTSARNNLVWSLASCPLPDQRDPARALTLAQHLMEQPDLGPPQWDTLAVVFAANGDFPKAIEYQQRAIDVVQSDDDGGNTEARLKRMKSRLAGYRKGRDYVQDYSLFAEIRAGRY